MLELAFAPPHKPAANQAPVLSARPASREGDGFHGRLREAIEAPPMAEQVPPDRTASRRDDSQDHVLSDRSGANPGEGASSSDPTTQHGATADAAKAATPSSPQAEQAETDTALGALVAEGAGMSQWALETAAPTAFAQADLSQGPAALLSDAVMSAVLLAEGQSVPHHQDRPAHSPILVTTGMAPGAVSAAPIGVQPDAAAPAGAQSGAGMPQALSAVALQAKAQALTVADQQHASAPAAQAVQQALSATNTPESPSDQQQGLLNALAAGPAQAAVAQEAKPQAAGGPARPAPFTPPREGPEGAKTIEALTLLTQAFNKTEAAAEVKLVMAAEPVEAGARLVGLEGPKSWGESRVEGPAMAPHGFAPADGVLQRTEAPAFSAGARDMAAPPAARQLAPVVVSLALGRGDEALTIALDPVELGRVEVSIGQGKEAGQVRIVAERPETLALLQRDQRELDRALNQAGLADMARSLSFSLASDQGRQQQHGSAHERGHPAPGIIGGLDHDRAMPVLPTPTRAATSLIDIAV